MRIEKIQKLDECVRSLELWCNMLEFKRGIVSPSLVYKVSKAREIMNEIKADLGDLKGLHYKKFLNVLSLVYVSENEINLYYSVGHRTVHYFMEHHLYQD